MTRVQNLIKKIQNKPYETRVKILWIAVGVVAVILIIIWVISLKTTIKGLDGKNLISADSSAEINSLKTDTTYLAVERIEQAASSFRVYFNVDNQTDDILNFPALENITLDVDNQNINPEQITDRQSKPFVQKILSRTQNFGILIFQPVTGDSGQLTIDQMSFEKTPDQQFHQELKLDFKALKESANLRN